MAKPVVTFCLGAPGSGKSTNCKRASQYGYHYISAGDCLRSELQKKPNSKHAQTIERCLREGRIVPTSVTCALLKNAMDEISSSHGPLVANTNHKTDDYDENYRITDQSTPAKFIIDGYPRNKENVEGWLTMIGDDVKVEKVVYLDVSESVRRERLMSRFTSSQRVDDTLDVVKKRNLTHEDDTPIVFEALRRNGIELEIIRNDGLPEEVWREFSAALSIEI